MVEALNRVIVLRIMSGRGKGGAGRVRVFPPDAEGGGRGRGRVGKGKGKGKGRGRGRGEAAAEGTTAPTTNQVSISLPGLNTFSFLLKAQSFSVCFDLVRSFLLLPPTLTTRRRKWFPHHHQLKIRLLPNISNRLGDSSPG